MVTNKMTFLNHICEACGYFEVGLVHCSTCPIETARQTEITEHIRQQHEARLSWLIRDTHQVDEQS